MLEALAHTVGSILVVLLRSVVFLVQRAHVFLRIVVPFTNNVTMALRAAARFFLTLSRQALLHLLNQFSLVARLIADLLLQLLDPVL